MSADRASLRGVLLVLAAAVLFGTAGVGGQALAARTGLAPIGVAFWRVAVAAAVLLVMQALRGKPMPSGSNRRVRGGIVLVGAGLGLYQVSFFAAVAATGVSIATLVALGLAPLLVALWAVVVRRERQSVAVVVALAAALAGLVLLVGAPAGGGRGAVLLGAALAAGSAAGYAAVTLRSQRLVSIEGIGSETLTAYGFGVAALLVAPFALVAGIGVPWSLPSVALIAYLGIGPTALGYRLFFAGLRSTSATVATIVTLAEPLTATTLAAVGGERLGVTGFAGGALLIAAVAVLAFAPAPTAPLEVPTAPLGSARRSGGSDDP